MRADVMTCDMWRWGTVSMLMLMCLLFSLPSLCHTISMAVTTHATHPLARMARSHVVVCIATRSCRVSDGAVWRCGGCRVMMAMYVMHVLMYVMTLSPHVVSPSWATPVSTRAPPTHAPRAHTTAGMWCMRVDVTSQALQGAMLMLMGWMWHG